MSELSGEQVLAEGIPLELLGGRTVRIKAANRALVNVERHFGGFIKLQEELGRPFTDSPEHFTNITKAIYCMLQHDPEWRDKYEQLLDAVDHQKSFDGTYKMQILEAIEQGFPQLAQMIMNASKTQPPPMSTEDEVSTGLGFIPSLDDVSDSVTMTSGT